MSSFKNHLQQKGLSKATIDTYYTESLKFIAWCDAQNIDPDTCESNDITAYLKHLQNKGQQNKTRSFNLNILKQYFNWLVQEEKRQHSPAAHIKIRGASQKKLYPTFSKQELESLYHDYEVPTDQHPKAKQNWFTNYRLSKQRNKAILSLMIYQGLATDEVNRLTLNDLKLREGTIYIAGTRKSNERTMELKSHQIMELMEYTLQVRPVLLKLIAVPLEQLFLPTPAAGKKTISANPTINVWKRLSEDMRVISIKFINFQQVRTSVITHWLKQHNLRQVQYMAGHKYVSSTEKFLVNQVEDLQNDIEQFHPIG